MLFAVLNSTDKESCLSANFSKCHGKLVQHWLQFQHHDALLVPVTRSSGSHNHQDKEVQAAAAVYEVDVSLANVTYHNYSISHHVFILQI